MKAISTDRNTGASSIGAAGRLSALTYGLLLTLGVTFTLEPQTVWGFGRLIQFSALELLLYTLLAAWGLHCIVARRIPRIPRALVLPLALFWGTQLLAALFASGEIVHALKFCYRLTLGILTGWCAYDTLNSAPRRLAMLKALALGGALVGVVGVLEAFTGTGGEIAALFRRGPATVGDLSRVSATLVFPTVTALALELTLPLLLLWFSETRQRWQKAMLGALLIVGMVALVLTLSRAGIGLLGLILLALAAGGWWQARRATRTDDTGRYHLTFSALSTAAILGLLTVLLLYYNPTARLRLVSETEATWYRALYQSEPLPPLSPGARARVPITVTNSSPRAWEPSASQPFLLSYHLYEEDGTLVTYDGARTVLTETVVPGETVTLNAALAVPPEAGEYLVVWDMLQEQVAWFSWKENEPYTTTLTVEGTPAATTGDMTITEAPVGAYRIATPTRFELWRIALGMVRERPLLGIGPDTFRLRYGYALGYDKFDPHIHTNNQYIEFLVGSGLVGLAGFLLFSGTLALQVWSALQRETGSAWRWQFALGCLLLVWYIHGLVDSFWEFTPTFVLFWLLVALALLPLRHEKPVGQESV